MMKGLVCVVLAVAGSAQGPPAFEVASVRPTAKDSGPWRVTERIDADGINFANEILRLTILRAYGLKPYQLTGPEWIGGERFSIVAKAGHAAPESEMLAMLRTLLEDRFKLGFHRESKEMPVYALVVGRGGPKLAEAKDEGAVGAEAGDGDELVFSRTSMDLLANMLGQSLDRPVIDETGLKGSYNFKLSWWAERRRKGQAGAAADSSAPSIFTELPARVGLRLEPRRAPVEMFVIDRVVRPSEN